MTERLVISKRLVAINSASSFATRLISISVLVWLQQYLLKRVSAEEYSLLPVLYSVMMLTPFLAGILSSGVRRYVLDAYVNENDERVTEIVSTILPLLCAAAVCLLAAGMILVWHIDSVFRIAPEYVDDARIMLALLVFSAAVRLPLAAFVSGLFVRQKFVLHNLIELGTESLRLVLLMILLFGISTKVMWVVVATVSADLVNVLARVIVSRRLVPAQRFNSSHIHWKHVGDLVRFGSWSSLDGLATMIRKAAPPIILNRMATPVDVAAFHVGSLVHNRLEVMIQQSVTRSVTPVVMGMQSTSRNEQVKNTYLRVGRFALWAFLIIVAPFLVYHDQIIRLYIGDTYLAAGTVMFFLLGCYPIIYGNILHTVLAQAQLRMFSLAWRNSISAAANLLLSLLLVGYYQLGAVGAAVAMFVTYGLGSLLLLWPFGKQLADTSWQEIWSEILLPGISPFLVSSMAMYGIGVLHPVDTWTALLLNSGFGGCVYLTVLWLATKHIDRRQFLGFLRTWRRPRVAVS